MHTYKHSAAKHYAYLLAVLPCLPSCSNTRQLPPSFRVTLSRQTLRPSDPQTLAWLLCSCSHLSWFSNLQAGPSWSIYVARQSAAPRKAELLRSLGAEGLTHAKCR